VWCGRTGNPEWGVFLWNKEIGKKGIMPGLKRGWGTRLIKRKRSFSKRDIGVVA